MNDLFVMICNKLNNFDILKMIIHCSNKDNTNNFIEQECEGSMFNNLY